MDKTLARLCFLLPLLVAAVAQAVEYRTFRLQDGRVISGEVVETGADGMRVRINQGVVLVPYALLSDIQSADPTVLASAQPLRVAIAPVAGAGAAQGRLDQLFSSVGPILPRVDLIDAALWGRALGAGSRELPACQGERDCLRGLALRIRADWFLIPKVTADGASMSLDGFDVASSASLGSSFLGVRADDVEFAQSLGPAIFASLGITPEVDPSALARARVSLRAPSVAGSTAAPAATPAPTPSQSPAATAQPARAPAPDAPPAAQPPATTPPATAATTPTPAPATSATPSAPPGGTVTGEATPSPTPASSAVTTPAPAIRPTPAIQEPDLRARGAASATRPSRGLTVALGFLPVPGLGAGLLGDAPGVLIAAGGTVGLSWLSVYGIGASARTAPSFWAPSILVPWAIAVGFNQVTTAVAWKRLERRAALALVPVVSVEPGAARFGVVATY